MNESSSVGEKTPRNTFLKAFRSFLGSYSVSHDYVSETSDLDHRYTHPLGVLGGSLRSYVHCAVEYGRGYSSVASQRLPGRRGDQPLLRRGLHGHIVSWRSNSTMIARGARLNAASDNAWVGKYLLTGSIEVLYVHANAERCRVTSEGP
jgi:hypothetical protein